MLSHFSHESLPELVYTCKFIICILLLFVLPVVIHVR